MLSDKIYLVDGSTLYRFDPATNTNISIGATGVTGLQDIAAAPDGSLFAISATSLYRIDAQTGAATLVGDLGVDHASALTFAGGRMLLATSDSGALYAVDRDSAKLHAIGDDAPTGSGTGLVDLVAGNGIVVGLRADGTLVAYARGDGDVLATFDTHIQNASGLALGADGKLYVFGDGKAWTVDAASGTVALATSLPAGITGAASINDHFQVNFGGHEAVQIISGTDGDDTLNGTTANEIFVPGAGNDTINGGGGIDAVRFAGKFANFAITIDSTGITVTDKTGAQGTDHLQNIDVLRFDDKTMFVLDGGDGTIARLYAAALCRAPDEDGLRVQLDAFHNGVSAHDLAFNFLHSAEFTARYGASIDDRGFVQALYHNVLGRDGDDGGMQVQLNALAHGLSREQLLLNFADSAENRSHVGSDWLLG